MLERRDVANKSEFGRLALAQQRMQQNLAGASSISLADGNARVGSHGVNSLAPGNQIHQGSQAGGGVGSHDGGNSQVQESDRSTGVEGSVQAGNDQSIQQSPSAVNDGHNAIRRNGALGLVASAASAFDAAKDIMEALRSKHTNLASELEVINLLLFHYHSPIEDSSIFPQVPMHFV